MKYIILTLLIIPNLLFASFDKNLGYGAKGEEVKELQEFLISEECMTGEATGNYYSITVKAVKCFQGKNGINTTGYFGTLTRTKANELLTLSMENEEVLGSVEPQTFTLPSGAIVDKNGQVIGQTTESIEMQKLQALKDELVNLRTQQAQQAEANRVLLEKIANPPKIEIPKPVVVIPEVKKEFKYLTAVYSPAGFWVEILYSENGEPIEGVPITATIESDNGETYTLTKNSEYVNHLLPGVSLAENKEPHRFVGRFFMNIKKPGKYYLTATYNGMTTKRELVADFNQQDIESRGLKDKELLY